jgi:diphosphomevalonate decarboxylase
MNDSVVIPGKIFLMGEYSVVQGGQAIVAALNPAYHYRVNEPAVLDSTKNGFSQKIKLHADSPAGKYLSEKKVSLSLHCESPGLGAGFGTSTAELISVAMALAAEKNQTDLSALWRWYGDAFSKASGADLAVQFAALQSGTGIFEVSGKSEVKAVERLGGGSAEGTPSLFKNIFIFQNSPDQKLATHVDLKKDFVFLNTELANSMVARLKKTLAAGSLAELNVLTEWAEWLAKLGLETPLAREIRCEFLDLPEVIAAKGCGAGLHDVFLVVVPDAVIKNIEQITAKIVKKYQLRFLGSLGERLWNSSHAFAPVNIAWIKYMGKTDGGPANSSLSMTLDQVGTHTRITVDSESTASTTPDTSKPALLIRWDEKKYIPPPGGQAKVEKFLSDQPWWAHTLARLGYSVQFPKSILISTSNNVPAATGIATSASAFAALTLAWVAILVGEQKTELCKRLETDDAVKKILAHAAQKGSGSACRSLMGPWVEWDVDLGIENLEVKDFAWIDFILLIEEESKKISSSEAHERVKTSPHWSGRTQRASQRLQELKNLFFEKEGEYLNATPASQRAQISVMQKIVLAEALDMHELFHSAQPPFTYWKPESKQWIEKFANKDISLPTQNAVITLDAGANVHCFVPLAEATVWREYFSEQKVKFLTAAAGTGAHYA